MRHLRFLIGSAVLALAACGGGYTAPNNTGGGGGGGGGGGSTTDQISIGDNFFNPALTTVPVGTTITWTWAGNNNHNVTSDNGAFPASATQSTGMYSVKFSTAATYAYHCVIHGAAMSGTIKVQ